jgi:hypothetical protein
MAFNINKFSTNIRDFGYLDNNSFEVFVQTPPVMTQNGGALGNQGTPVSLKQISENMSFRVDQVRAPGISLISSDINHYGIGPTQKKPTNAQYQETNISMIGDHFCEFWQYWYQWTRSIFQYSGTSTGQAPTYTAEYKDQYSSTIVIVIYDHYGNSIQKINLFEAFPSALREIPLSWGDGNLMRINVSLAYTEYTIEGSSILRTRSQPGGLSTAKERETIGVGVGSSQSIF